MKYIEAFREHFKSFPVFSISDARVFLSQFSISSNYTFFLLHYLRKRGEIRKITRGIYSFKKEAEVIGFAFSPFYYGLQDALSFRDLWEQETNPVVITTRKVRTGVRTIAGSKVVIRRISRSMFFGFENLKSGDLYLPFSDIEKTLIDFVYFRQFLDSRTIKKMIERMDKKRMHSYLLKIPEWLRKKVVKKMSV